MAAVCAVIAVWLYVFFAFRGQPGDDPYITYRYAANLVSGNGFVFNPGEHVQSTTTPLYALLLAGGGLLGLDIPALGYALSMLCLLAFALCAVRLVSLYFTPWLGLAAVVLTFACPVTTYGLGGEMPLLMALSWGAWWAAASGRWNVCALLAGLAGVTRGDGLLVGGSIVLIYVATYLRVSPRRWPWGAAGLFVLVAAPWYMFAWLYFASPLPATLGAKVAQGATPGTTLFLDGLGQFWARSFDNIAALWVPALLLLMAGVFFIAKRGVWLNAPIAWALVFAAAFSLLRVPRYPWYYSPLVAPAALALIAGGGAAVYRARKRLEDALAGGAIVCLTALAVFLFVDSQSARPEASARSQLYISTGRWLAANTPASASVGAEEVGLLGYYSERRIVDFVGLIQPDVAQHRAKGDNLWAVQTYRPDYILGLDPWMAAVGQSPEVRSTYSVLRTFDGPSGEHATLLVRKP